MPNRGAKTSRRRTGDAEIGRRIRAARELAGLLQRELAAKVKVDKDYISQLEAGYTSPSLPVFKAICLACGVSADFLLFGMRRDSVRDAEEAIMQVLDAVGLRNLQELAKLPATRLNTLFEFIRA